MVQADAIEAWRPIVGYEDAYSVSNLGHVRRDAGGKGGRIGRILRPRWVGSGPYLAVNLPIGNGRYGNMYVADLVLAAFVGPKPEGLTVNHRDGDKANNRLDNLEYATYSEQRHHAMRLGLWTISHANFDGQRGRLTGDQVREIRARVAAGETMTTVARELGVSIGYVSLIVRRLKRPHD